MSENLDPLAGRIGEERVSDKTPIARQHGSSAPDSNFMTSPLIVTPRTTVASTSSNRSQVSYIETAFTNGLEVMETQGRQSANFGNDIRGNGVPHSNIGSVAHTVFEEPFADSDQEESTGSQTPRRREGAATGFGFSLMRPPSNTPDSFTKTSQLGSAISTNTLDQKTHRRPSLLTQQILSSPAIPLATRSNALSKQPKPILQKRPSLKDRVKGSLVGNGPNPRDALLNASEAQGGRNDYPVSHAGASSYSDTRSRKGSTGTHISSRPSFDEHLEELVEDFSTPDYRGRPKRNVRRRTYNEGSSQDDLGSGFSHGTGGSVWDRSVTGFTTDDDEGVIETQDINFTKDARTGRKMINQYVILREIGRGQHGQVRLGQDLSALEMARTGNGLAAATQSPPSDHAIHSRTLSWTENQSTTAELATSPATMSPAGAGFWAIKIMDRQPRKKLPGVKKLTSNQTGQDEEVKQATFTNEKLKKEIAILKKCRHPNVVRLREVIDAPASKKIYLVLEYCEGGEVKWKTDDGRPLLTLDQSRRILRDIVLGLEYLHHQGIIHRDIKPANLLYTADGVVKISDFGVSHYSHVLRGQQAGEEDLSPEDGDELGFANEHDLAKTAGSPAFFAPELCFSDLGPPSGGSSPSRELSTYTFPSPSDLPPDSRSSLHSAHSASHTLRPRSPIIRRERPPITEAIDIWALGVTLYCFLFAQVPFDSTSEFHLLSIIPTQDFSIPSAMGADSIPTGGRTGYLKGLSAGVSQEACEAIDLLVKLLEKDPLKRIKLADVKKHPFTLRGLSDTSAWLKSTDSTSRNTVIVSHAEVAAAVTKSGGSFRDKFRKGVKNLSNRIFGHSPVPSNKPRSRSHSVVQTGDPGNLGDNAGGSRSAMGSLNRSQSRLTSGWSQRVASPYFDREKRAGSPVPGGLVRRLSVLGSKSSRSISPLPPGDPFAHSSATRGTVVGLHVESNQLGRSVSDRSTTSSVGALSLGRSAPLRRQSTQLVPPVVGNFEISAPVGRKNLSTSNSVERLNANTQTYSQQGHESLGDSNVKRRDRAASTASSITGISSGNLQSKFSQLLSRGSSQKNASSSSVALKPPSSGAPQRNESEDFGLTSGHIDRSSSRIEPDVRSQTSRDTLASQIAAPSRLSSPLALSHGLPELPVLAPLTLDSHAPGQHTRCSPLLPSDNDIDKADWEGDLSDDDDDYGEPIRRTWGGDSSQRNSWDRTPQNIQDLANGTWIMDGQGWRPGNHPGPIDAAFGGNESGSARTGDLQLDVGDIEPASRFPEADVPATIAETDAELEAEPLKEEIGPRSPIGFGLNMPQDHLRLAASSPPSRNDTHSVRNAVPASPNHVRSPQRANDRLWVSPVSNNDMFDDADEDEDDDGLEIDVGLKRGRRFSKPLTPALDGRPSLPPI